MASGSSHSYPSNSIPHHAATVSRYPINCPAEPRKASNPKSQRPSKGASLPSKDWFISNPDLPTTAAKSYCSSTKNLTSQKKDWKLRPVSGNCFHSFPKGLHFPRFISVVSFKPNKGYLHTPSAAPCPLPGSLTISREISCPTLPPKPEFPQ